jgi:glyoxylase-like metal-dependent hydrolase (beta-lactamase superfamily II)
MSDDIHEVYAIKYGRHERGASENFIGGDPHDGPMPLDYFVWAIVGAKGVIILDTGFDETVGARRGRSIVRPVREGLNALAIAPEKVETVILSHMHYDHCGNDALFPNARFHLQDREMEYATGRCMCHAQLRNSYEFDYVVAMLRNVYAGRAEFHDGVGEIAPGVTVHHVGGHAKGLQCVRVKTRVGHVVLASDATHFYRHMDEGRIFPTTFHLGEVLEGYRTLRKLADAPQHIVPGHDPAVMERYPAAKAGMEGWIVRLDAEPKAQ